MADFETICKFKDSSATNLNDTFDSFGTSTLEAKVPVVTIPVVEQIQGANPKQRLLATLALKSESAAWAMAGRHPRTRNKELRVVEMGGEVMLAAGQERDRSPVDRNELDDDLEVYARERARLKALKLGTGEAQLQLANISLNDKENKEKDLDADILDQDLSEYMQEAARKKAQKKRLNEQSERMSALMQMEEDWES